MKAYRTAILAAAIAIAPTLASAGHYGRMIYKPHHTPHIPQKPSPAKATPGQSGSNQVLPNVLYGIGVCMLTGQIADFIRVGITENRRRTDKEVEAVFAFCSVVGIPIWLHRWSDGKRVPKPMPDVIDRRHDPIS